MGCDESCSERDYSGLDVSINNLPYAVMILLGVAVLLVGLGPVPAAWAAAGAYVLYGLAGAFWIVLFVCPSCPSFGSGSCPCGYGAVSARLRAKQDPSQFARRFRRHIPVIVPLWLIPPAVGGTMAAREFSWVLVGLLAAFAVDAFVVLPLYSRLGCRRCPQREACPWMAKGPRES